MVRQRALIVEDDQSTQFLVSTQLEMIGYEADIASNAIQALENFVSKKYAIILMDIKMVGSDGVEVTKNMRIIEHEHGSKPTPIIALTGRASDKDKQHYLNHGMTDFLAKPYSMGDLSAILSRHAPVLPAI